MRQFLSRHHVVTRFVVWLAAYTAVTSFTRPIFFGDTRGYAVSILQFIRGDPLPYWGDNAFWDFGHVLWRPTGYFVFKTISPLTSLWVGQDLRTNIAACLLVLSWIAGFLTLLLLNAVLRRLCNREWPANLMTVGFLFAQSFLNFAQTGCSYISGLLLLQFALFVLIFGISRSAGTWPVSLAAGAALAAAVGFWFLYILAFPAAVALPLYFFGKITRKRIQLALLTATFSGFFVAIIYGLVIAHLGLYRVRDLMIWISASSHGVDHVRGFARLAFGFCRSVINMGNDGVSFKRFLRRDPYNPVSIWQFPVLGVAKFLFFYSVVAAIVVALWESQQRKILLGLLFGSAPLMGFAVLWQGGDMERYLPIFPFLFMAISLSLCDGRSPRWSRMWTVIFVVVLVLINGAAFLRWHSSSRKEYQLSRIVGLRPLLKNGSQIVVLEDELTEIKNDPLNTTAQDDALPIYIVTGTGTSKVLHWREDFAALAFSVWEAGADVWVSKRLLKPRPVVNTTWVEGDDGRISWQEVYFFFSGLDMGASAGNEDGFELVLPSSKNRNLMNALSSDRLGRERPGRVAMPQSRQPSQRICEAAEVALLSPRPGPDCDHPHVGVYLLFPIQ
jgi:hypothetical protein